ncbi:MAG: energy-coupled thiamine transporter ThiT [Bacilli bacterium]|nr:energy-coupled thiamine transporter ThiT [Bacilli bacterium]
MRRLQYVIYTLLAMIGIAGLFAPYLFIDEGYQNIFGILANYQVSGLFALIFVAFSLYFVGIILLYFIEKNKWIAPSSLLLLLVATVLFSCSKTFCKESIDYGTLRLSVSPIVMAIVSLGTSVYTSRYIFDNTKLSIRDIAEIGIFVSFAFVLDLPLFKIKIVANGGSISLIMLPLILLSLRKGFFKGFIGAGIVFGLVSCFLDGYGLITYPLDYLLGFGSLAVVGLFRRFIIGKEKLNWMNYGVLFLATLLAMSMRTFASTLSGIFIYELDFTSSLIYQLTYMGPSFGVVMVILLILLYPLNKLSLKNK